MKKIVFPIIAVILTLSLSGCIFSSPSQDGEPVVQDDSIGEIDSPMLNIIRDLRQVFPRIGTRYDPYHGVVAEISESLMEMIIPALESNDRDALKNLFSESTLAESKDIEECINLIMEHFQGITTELTGGVISRGGSTDTTRLQFQSRYIVATTQNVYELRFTYVHADDRNPSNDGLHSLTLIIYEDRHNFGWAASVRAPELQDNPYHGLLDEVMERVVAALDISDREALMDMFSESALTDAQNIEEDIDLIIELYQGTMTESVRTGSRRNGSNSPGSDILNMDGAYIIETAQNVYVLGFTYFFIDDRSPTNVGLRSMQLITIEEFSDFRWAGGMHAPALQDSLYHDYLDEVMDRIIAALNAQDRDALMAMFSERALERAENIEMGVDLIIGSYQGILTEQVMTGWRSTGRIGVGFLELTGAYKITTTQSVYILYFTYVHDNERYPISLGLRSIRFLTYEEFSDFGWAGGIRVPELEN